jgi:hypothetical protein
VVLGIGARGRRPEPAAQREHDGQQQPERDGEAQESVHVDLLVASGPFTMPAALG